MHSKHGQGRRDRSWLPARINRLSSSEATTLGAGFGRGHPGGDYRGAALPELPRTLRPARRVDLVIDIPAWHGPRARGQPMRRPRSPQSTKQMAAALEFIWEQELADYAALEASTERQRWIAWPGELRGRGASPKTARLMERPRWTMSPDPACRFRWLQGGTVKMPGWHEGRAAHIGQQKAAMRMKSLNSGTQKAPQRMNALASAGAGGKERPSCRFTARPERRIWEEAVAVKALRILTTCSKD